MLGREVMRTLSTCDLVILAINLHSIMIFYERSVKDEVPVDVAVGGLSYIVFDIREYLICKL